MGAGREDDMSEKLNIEDRIERALQMVHALCRPRGSKDGREWIMSIPARPDYDPDLVISDGLMAGRSAASELAQAQADVEALRVELLLILRQVDYTNGACAVNEMVGAVLPHQIISRARERLAALPEHLRGAK
jgi:hypothetical protein